MRRLVRLGGYGTIMTAGTLSAYRLTVGSGPVSETDATRGTVVALTAFVFFQLFNLQNARFPDHSALPCAGTRSPTGGCGPRPGRSLSSRSGR